MQSRTWKFVDGVLGTGAAGNRSEQNYGLKVPPDSVGFSSGAIWPSEVSPVGTGRAWQSRLFPELSCSMIDVSLCSRNWYLRYRIRISKFGSRQERA